MIEYDIGGKKYIQKPLVLGQLQQLLKLLEGIKIDTPTPMGIVTALGEKLHKALAIVLIPDGVSVKDKDIEALADELAFEADIDVAVKVIEDFFACNNLGLLLQRVAKVIEGIAEQMRLKNWSAFSPQETSQKETM